MTSRTPGDATGAPQPVATSGAHALLDQGAAGLQLAVGEALDARVEAEAGLDAVEVDLDGADAEAELAAELLAVALGEQHRDVGDLGEDVEVGGEAGDGAVEEHEVLDVQHQLLGHPRAVAEQRP